LLVVAIMFEECSYHTAHSAIDLVGKKSGPNLATLLLKHVHYFDSALLAGSGNHVKECSHHAGNSVLNLVELAVEHEGGGAHQLVALVHADVLHILENQSHCKFHMPIQTVFACTKILCLKPGVFL
jgi:hypothetical protein